MVLGVSVLLAVSRSVTAPLAVAAVMSALPVTESTPALFSVIVPPRATVPPPVRPVPALTVMELLANWLLATVPANCDADTVPLKPLALSAAIAYGTGVNCWRGVSVVKGLAPLVSTPISSQLVWPVNTPGPKSTSTVNRPLVTTTALLVTGPAMGTPPVLVLNSVKVRL